MGQVISNILAFIARNPELIAQVTCTALSVGQELISQAKTAFSAPAPNPAPMPESMTVEEISRKRRIARERLRMNTETDFNFAFCGQLKAGKSRMINAVRGVKEDERGYAPINTVRCTEEIEPYRFMDGTNDNLVLWDCPGAGQIGADVKTYFNDKMLYAFDFLMIFLLETVREEDLKFAAEAFRHGVPFAFVRSKCDVNLYERVLDGSKLEEAKKSFIEENRPFYISKLKEGGNALADAPLFFVSATVLEKSTPQKIDKNRLEEDKLIACVVQKTLARRGCFDPPS